MKKPILDESTDISKVNFNSYFFYINNILTEAFIEKYKNKIDWWHISVYQELSEAFIEKYSDKVFWVYISVNQTLSEVFIEKHEDKVDWHCIFKYQKISNKFIAKHINKLNFINFKLLKLNENIDQVFVEKLELLK